MGSSAQLVIVDDDGAFRDAAARAATAAGVEAEALASARLGLERLPALGTREGPSHMVVGLVMPRSNGRGILGGIEILRRAAELQVAQRVFLGLDAPHADAESIARELGAAGVLHKPQPDATTAAESVSACLGPVLRVVERREVTASDVVLELRRELGASTREWQVAIEAQREESSRTIDTLQSLLAELNDPAFDEQIPLLILRFASMFFVRGVLFRVDEEQRELTGTGGFGLMGSDAGRLVRAIRIPLAADSVFRAAMHQRAGLVQPFFDSEWNVRLATLLGGARPREAFTAPLRSPSGLEGMLYADNGCEPRPFPDLQLLEIYVQQGAAALERARLKNQILRMKMSSSSG